MSKIVLALLFSLSLYAEGVSGVNEAQMQKMMQEMQKVQVCLSRLDMGALERMQTEAMHAQHDIKKLCDTHQRDKAQKTAISFTKRMMSMHVVSELKACLKDSPMAEMMDITAQDFSHKHVCDGESIDLGVPSQNRINW